MRRGETVIALDKGGIEFDAFLGIGGGLVELEPTCFGRTAIRIVQVIVGIQLNGLGVIRNGLFMVLGGKSLVAESVCIGSVERLVSMLLSHSYLLLELFRIRWFTHGRLSQW